MKSNQTIIALLSLSMVSGCFMPKVRTPQIPVGKPYNPPDLELTLVQKEMPQRYIDAFTRAELSFSTNKTQETHAILIRPLTVEIAEKIKSIPFGTTMKESEWDKVLLNKKKMPDGQILRLGGWQRFY